jgi:hypothetical protein
LRICRKSVLRAHDRERRLGPRASSLIKPSPARDRTEPCGVLARRSRRHPLAFAAVPIDGPPVLRGAVQDDEVPPRVPRPVRQHRAQARAFFRQFIGWYNHQHRHSGIGLMTPATVHHGRAEQTHAARADVLNAAYAATPERFVRRPPRPPALPTAPVKRRLPPWCFRPLRARAQRVGAP